MKSIKEQKQDIDNCIMKYGVQTIAGSPAIDAVMENNAELLAWAERTLPLLQMISWYAGDHGVTFDKQQWELAKQLLEDLQP